MARAQVHLKRRDLDRALQRDGYVVVPVLTQEQVAEAREVFYRHDSGIDSGYYASIHSPDTDYKRSVDSELRKIIWDQMRNELLDHRCLVAAMMVKPPTGATVVPLHQDWNVMLESRAAGLTCWFPLTPVTELEGRMRVLPGSHRYMGRLRGSPGFPAPFESIADQIDADLLVDVEVGVGDVMFMDGRLLHMTRPNRSGNTRIAAYLNVIPSSERSIHYYRHPDGKVEGFEVGPNFFTDFNIGERPPGEPFETLDSYEVEQMTMEELLALRRRSQRRLFRRA